MTEIVPGGVTRGELERGGRILRWIEAGRGGPTVVLGAAGGSCSLTWVPILPALAEHVRVIAYDRAGLGMSDPSTPPTIEAAVADLTALLAHAGNGPCVLVGNSWGGLLAQLVAWASPDLIAGLVLIDPAHEDFQPWIGRLAERALFRAFSMQKVLGLAERTLRKQAVTAARAATDDPRIEALLVDAELACYAHESQIRAIRDEHRMLARQLPAVRAQRASSRLPDVPVIVLSASKGLPGKMRSRWTALQADIAATAGRGQHAIVADAGHYIHRSQPAAVTKAILTVIESY